MAIETSNTIPTIDHKRHAAFFRQSGWLMMASILGGLMSLGVQFLNKKIPAGEYANFGELNMLIVLLPTTPLQMIFVQQTARALVFNRERQLAGMIRLVWIWTFVLWAAAALLGVMSRGWIAGHWNVATAALFVTIPSLL